MLGLSLCVAPNAVANDKLAAKLSRLVDGIEAPMPTDIPDGFCRNDAEWIVSYNPKP